MPILDFGTSHGNSFNLNKLLVGAVGTPRCIVTSASRHFVSVALFREPICYALSTDDRSPDPTDLDPGLAYRSAANQTTRSLS